MLNDPTINDSRQEQKDPNKILLAEFKNAVKNNFQPHIQEGVNINDVFRLAMEEARENDRFDLNLLNLIKSNMGEIPLTPQNQNLLNDSLAHILETGKEYKSIHPMVMGLWNLGADLNVAAQPLVEKGVSLEYILNEILQEESQVGNYDALISRIDLSKDDILSKALNHIIIEKEVADLEKRFIADGANFSEEEKAAMQAEEPHKSEASTPVSQSAVSNPDSELSRSHSRTPPSHSHSSWSSHIDAEKRSQLLGAERAFTSDDEKKAQLLGPRAGNYIQNKDKGGGMGIG